MATMTAALRILGGRAQQRNALSMGSVAARGLSSAAEAEPRLCTFMPGDGVGPEISKAVKDVLRAAGVPLKFEQRLFSPDFIDPATNSMVTKEGLDSIKKNMIAIKGPMGTPIGSGHRSLNLTLRKELKLYANVRPCLSIPGLKTAHRYDDVDLVTIRENTEGEYSGLEHEVVPGVVESLKVITREASMRVAEYAFKYATDKGRKKVTAVHKANIMKQADGLFLECVREVHDRYPDIEYDEKIVDNCCMQLVTNPAQFDVMVMPNLYGDIVSDLCAGLIGGLGLTPSMNVGDGGMAIAEAVHGTAPDIEGKNLANPTALLMSTVMLLHHIELDGHADRIEKALLGTIGEGKFLTGDLGGTATTTDFTKAIIDRL